MIDLCKDRGKYYKQTNNEVDPLGSCQCTSMAAAMDLLGIVRPFELLGKRSQPEDNLREYIRRDPDVLAFCRSSHPGSTIHPSEWADVLCFAVNKILGRKAARFDGALTVQTILADLAAGLPVMASVRFPERNVEGHYVLVVGTWEGGLLKNDPSDNLLTGGGLLVNDPYKNLLNGSADGFHCLYSTADWAAHAKGYGIRFSKA